MPARKTKPHPSSTPGCGNFTNLWWLGAAILNLSRPTNQKRAAVPSQLRQFQRWLVGSRTARRHVKWEDLIGWREDGVPWPCQPAKLNQLKVTNSENGRLWWANFSSFAKQTLPTLAQTYDLVWCVYVFSPPCLALRGHLTYLPSLA